MTDSSIKKADSFLQMIFTKAKMLEALNQKVANYLDSSLRNSCQVGNVSGSKLVLIVATGSVATQLRFQIPDLLRKFKTDPELMRFQEIQTKVRPAQSVRATRQTKKVAPLSTASAEIIREVAESIDDPKLKEVLGRIAKRTKHQPE